MPVARFCSHMCPLFPRPQELETNVRLVEVLRRDLSALQEDMDNLTVESQVRCPPSPVSCFALCVWVHVCVCVFMCVCV